MKIDKILPVAISGLERRQNSTVPSCRLRIKLRRMKTNDNITTKIKSYDYHGIYMIQKQITEDFRPVLEIL